MAAGVVTFDTELRNQNFYNFSNINSVQTLQNLIVLTKALKTVSLIAICHKNTFNRFPYL